jgi:hypothetical protein
MRLCQIRHDRLADFDLTCLLCLPMLMTKL